MLWVLFSLLILLLAAAAVWLCIWENNALVHTPLDLYSDKLPAEFDGYCIAHLSDLHNKWFGERQKKTEEILRLAAPDLVVITGDLIDKRRTRSEAFAPALALAGQAALKAPVYYVSGNHEWQSGLYPKLCPALQKEGVVVLDGKAVPIQRQEARMVLIGLPDIASMAAHSPKDPVTEAQRTKFREQLHILKEAYADTFCILLSHRPELFYIYAKEGVDLAFCGHAHGGQVRLPGIGGLFAPGQGFLPPYTQGLCKKDGSVMAVSRGMGNSLFPARIFNRPEIVTLTLHCGKKNWKAGENNGF